MGDILPGPVVARAAWNAARAGRGLSHNLGEEEFRNRMQNLVDKLVTMNKTVFIVAETPHSSLPYQALFPILPAVPYSGCHPYTLDAFCPEEICLLVDENGMPLYNDDHLSIWLGGRFLIEHVLAPYLTP
ncbi:MAG: hypothetical protein LBE85_01700 [Candidatus Accumulibacter sp.]|jgi:hypothetical protein|nr:hypothetical protein [Accumulibacter sp.]